MTGPQRRERLRRFGSSGCGLGDSSGVLSLSFCGSSVLGFGLRFDLLGVELRGDDAVAAAFGVGAGSAGRCGRCFGCSGAATVATVATTTTVIATTATVIAATSTATATVIATTAAVVTRLERLDTFGESDDDTAVGIGADGVGLEAFHLGDGGVDDPSLRRVHRVQGHVPSVLADTAAVLAGNVLEGALALLAVVTDVDRGWQQGG